MQDDKKWVDLLVQKLEEEKVLKDIKDGRGYLTYIADYFKDFIKIEINDIGIFNLEITDNIIIFKILNRQLTVIYKTREDVIDIYKDENINLGNDPEVLGCFRPYNGMFKFADGRESVKVDKFFLNQLLEEMFKPLVERDLKV